MKYEIEQKLLNAGLDNSIYNRETWYQIINAMVDDLQQLIGCNFKRDKNKEIKLEIENPLRVSTTITIWTPEEDEQLCSNPTKVWLDIINHDLLKIEDTNCRSSIKWFGYIWGDMDEQLEDGNHEKLRNLFYADGNIFLFDPITEKRLSLETGESLIEFHFSRKSRGGSKWICLGWSHDYYGEWEHLSFF